MKLFAVITLSLIALGGTPTQAFISHSQAAELIEALNQTHPSIQVESFRCSLRSRMCLVRMEVGMPQRKVGCVIERVNEASDIFTEQKNKTSGIVSLALSAYATEALDQCLAE